MLDMVEMAAQVMETVASWAKFGAKLVLIEMFVPGGTLIVIALLWARRRHQRPGARDRRSDRIRAISLRAAEHAEKYYSLWFGRNTACPGAGLGKGRRWVV
jgi:hypothetical protein